jgi:hypothetical protein
MQQERESRAALKAVAAVIREHPIITTVMVVCTLGGAILGVSMLSADWSLARRLAGGLIGGAGIGLLVTATRMIG